MSEAAPAGRGYADAHPTIRITSKRFRLSPFAASYAQPETVWGVYSGRLYPLVLGDDPVAAYRRLRRDAVLYDVPEHPVEIAGPQATQLLQRLFCRRIDNLAVGRARYAIACRHDGGILMDGILLRLAEDRFWYVLADGEFMPWLDAQAAGLEVAIRDPDSSILQVQGPRAFEVLAALWEPAAAQALPYFHVRPCRVAGLPLLVSRTGWTGEMGFELYSEGPLSESEGARLWQAILAAGRPLGLEASGLESMGVRRIEAGILDNGTDMDPSMTPWAAGLGAFVDLEAGDFIGRDALAAADRRSRLLGLVCRDTTPLAEMALQIEGRRVGRVTAGGWSPTLGHGIGYACFEKPGDWLGTTLTLIEREGRPHAAEIVPLPFYDREKRIPRGLPPAGEAR